VTDGDDEHLLRELEKVVRGVGRMFPGLCEVVLHDLRDPEHAVRAIENGLSGRRVGDSATELGLARIADPDYPEVLQNYPGAFPDGRPVKSTSIGIRDRRGRYVAALCLNLDVSVVSAMTRTLTALAATDDAADPGESLRHRGAAELREVIEDYAARRAQTPRALGRDQKRELVRHLHRQGYFESRSSTRTIGELLGISRATVYNYAKQDT
jgi:predicted transcriptional regulator YheO